MEDIKKRCDIIFSEIIRMRDKHSECITCGKSFAGGYSAITCGHFMKRRHLNTRWSLDNAYGQCWPCNSEDDSILFQDKLEEKIGNEKVAEIITRSRQSVKLSRSEMNDLYMKLKEYKRKMT